MLNFVAGIQQRSSGYSEFSETAGFVSLLNLLMLGWWIDPSVAELLVLGSMMSLPDSGFLVMKTLLPAFVCYRLSS